MRLLHILIVLTMLCYVEAMEDDGREFFPFERTKHGAIMSRRIHHMKRVMRFLKVQLRKERKVERRIKRKLELNYDDLSMATKVKDKILIQRIIERLQTKLRKARNHRKHMLKELDRVTDGISGFERGRLIRKNRLERYVDYEHTDITKEFNDVQQTIFEIEKGIVVDFAKAESKKMTQFAFKTFQNVLAKEKQTVKDLTEEEKQDMRERMQEIAKKAFMTNYKRIHEIVEVSALKGLSKEQLKKLVNNKMKEISQENSLRIAESAKN